MKALWLKHDAHFGEHPKTLKLRRLAGRNADAAEVGWWRIVEGAKRYGEWTFQDDEHLAHVVASYGRFLDLYRQVGLLDGLTIHNAEEYQSPLSGAERVARHRDRSNAPDVTPVVTAVTPREEKSREEQNTEDAGDPEWLTAWFQTGHAYLPTPKQQNLIDGYLRAFDVTGPQRLAGVFLRNSGDPIGGLKADLATFRDERSAEAKRAESTTTHAPRRSRVHGFSGVNAELQKILGDQYADQDRAYRHRMGQHAVADPMCDACRAVA